MNELPLFPLNTVLFPGMPLNLRIFEERYKIMMNMCIENRKPFGVVLIADGATDTDQHAEPHLIGCTAQITQVQPLGGGRMNISAIGKDRFQVLSLLHDKPYLSGITEPFPLIDDDPGLARQLGYRLRGYINRYLSILAKAGRVQFESSQLPNDPIAVAYLSAVLLQNTSPEEKQRLLALHDSISLLNSLISTYRFEVTLMDTLVNPPDNLDFRGIFSLS